MTDATDLTYWLSPPSASDKPRRMDAALSRAEASSNGNGSAKNQ